MLAVAVLTSLWACGPERTTPFPAATEYGADPPVVAQLAYGVASTEAPTESKRVLVVVNTKSPISRQIGEYYAKARKIPAENVLTVTSTTDEQISLSEYRNNLQEAIRRAIKSNKNPIDFIVTTKGVPIRIGGDNGYGVDASLMAMNLTNFAIPETLTPGDPENPRRIDGARNPFFGTNKRFTSKEFKMYLVCRLDGYEWAHIKRLIDNSVAAKPSKGLFFFDEADNRRSAGYAQQQKTLALADSVITRKGLQSRLDTSATFVNPGEPLMGYASWGSNDGNFDVKAYRSLRFRPGALAETFVSTSGRTFRRTTGGQSLIADLIEGGVTGVKGYVSEPYTFALANPGMIFDYYTAGFNLAESFYGASLVIKWKDVVIGDPLCNPYAR